MLPAPPRSLVLVLVLSLAACGGSSTTSGGGAAGQGASGGAVQGGGGAGGGAGGDLPGGGGAGGGAVCTPGAVEACYDGPVGTEGVGSCVAGERVCLEDGSGHGECVGAVLPAPLDDCATPADDDCDGEANEAADGCVCTPGASIACYEGPAGTLGVGLCAEGAATCLDDGMGHGPCVGQVLPTAETCASPGDDDCDGQTNEEGPDCSCVPGEVASCYSGPPSTEGVGPCVGGTQVCNAQGDGFGPCEGETLPAAETCNTPVDDDCDGQTNEEGAGCVCPPSTLVACYSGPAGTEGVGICKAGLALCDEQGTSLGACQGDVLPAAETCNTPADDDCDGQTNEEGAGCVCLPGSVSACYTGPQGTSGVGLCAPGAQTCNGQGTGFGPCQGEVVPVGESCATAGDDDCDGQANEGCPVVTYALDVQPILQAKCAPCHTSNGSGGANFATSYADSQLSSYYCPGLTKGACALVRIQNGTMPFGAGCTGNPVLDAGKPACVTAAQQQTIQSWISQGQLP
jgi:hypothetical protein